MSISSESVLMSEIKIQVIPGDELITCIFNINKSFGYLKDELNKKYILTKATYFFKINDFVMNDNMILKDRGVNDESFICAVRNDSLRVILKMKDHLGSIRIIQKYMLISDFKIIKPDENKEVKNEEIKCVIDLLKDEFSDRLSILEDLSLVFDKFNSEWNKIGELFLSMGFLSSAIKIIEHAKDGDEKIVNLLVILINKICDREFKTEGTFLYKEKDAVSPLFSMIKYDNENEMYKEIIRTIVVIAKKCPSNAINNNNIKNSLRDIITTRRRFSSEYKKLLFLLFGEMIKEGIIKKGGYGSEIVEELLFMAEDIKEKNDNSIISSEILLKSINNFITIAKEKGLIENLYENKNEIIAESILFKLEKIFIFVNTYDNDSESGSTKEITKTNIYSLNEKRKRNDKLDDDKNIIIEEEEEKKEKEKEKEKEEQEQKHDQDQEQQQISKQKLNEEIFNIKNFCNYVASHCLNVQTQFIDEFSKDVVSINSRKNGLFLYYYLPLLFKMYHLEGTVPNFLKFFKSNYSHIPLCYHFVIKLYCEIIERMMKEEKEIEINEENIITILFLWSVRIEKGKKENEIEYLINSTVKIFEWLGRIEKEEEEIKNENNNKERKKENVNKKELFLFKFLDIIGDDFYKPKIEMKNIDSDGRIIGILLKIVKNHIKNERCLINKGNKKRIIEHIIYSYNEDIDTSNLLFLPSPSFPFSHRTIITIFMNILNFVTYFSDEKFVKKKITTYTIEIFNNYIDIMKIIDGCDIKKEIGREISAEWNNNILSKLYGKICLYWGDVYTILVFSSFSINLSSFDNEKNNMIKELTKLTFSHSNNVIYDYENEKNNNRMEKEMMLRPFLSSEVDRDYFTHYLICGLLNENFYSIFDAFYLINKTVGCDLLGIYSKDLSGEIVDKIKDEDGNIIKKERRRYERERYYSIFKYILVSLANIMMNTFKLRDYSDLGIFKNQQIYEGKEKEIKEDKDYISDIIEEEDMRECLILYLKHLEEDNHENLVLSLLSKYSNNILFYLFSKTNFEDIVNEDN